MDDAVKATAIRAMFVLVYDRDPATRSLAATMTIPTLDGASEVGVTAARSALVAALSHDPDEWSHWLTRVEQDKMAESMLAALDEQLLDELASQPENAGLVATFRSLNADLTRKTTLAKSLSTGANPVIDLRETVDVRTDAAAQHTSH